MNHTPCIHLIPNAHLDPAWLWDWREGHTEMLNTTRTVLELMDEFPSLTFVRGEAYLYRHIEENAPELFARLAARIAEGRWDVAGGTMVQSDMNLPATETMIRHLVLAQRYFSDRFGITARTGWSADCFGHSVAVPDLLAAAGLDSYSYTRPGKVPAASWFWWEGPAGGRLLVHRPLVGWYGMERHEATGRLDALLQAAAAAPCRNLICFLGLGNHGGHPTRRMLREVEDWRLAHPDVEVVYSTFSRYFAALRAELAGRPADAIPVFRGEINFAPRGIYAAAARFKFAYRQAEAQVGRAERLATVVAAAGTPSRGTAAGLAPSLRPAWEAILFNSFHDLLPGSSIERVYAEQFDWLAQAPQAARKVEERTVRDLAASIDTRVRPPAPDQPAGLPILVFNPHPWPYRGPLEIEGCLDFRPFWKYQQQPERLPVTVLDPAAGPLPLQKIANENLYVQHLNLRNRVAVPVEVPALGWKVLEFAYDESAAAVAVPEPATAGVNLIRAGAWEISAVPGETQIRIHRNGQTALDADSLEAATFEDPWGTWGDFAESAAAASLTEHRETWRIAKVEVMESGPLRATLNVRLAGGKSRLDLALSLWHDRDAVDVRARVFWDERCARLKLLLPGRFSRAVYDVMGGEICRGPAGEVPGGRWLRLEGGQGAAGFASDALYNFNLTPDGRLQATVVRASRYAADLPAAPADHPWQPVLDSGELQFRFLLTAAGADLERLAAELIQPPLAMQVLPGHGPGPKSGGFMALDPSAEVRLLAIKPAEDRRGWILRLQAGGREVRPVLHWLGQTLPLPDMPPFSLLTCRLQKSRAGVWRATPTTLLEF